MDQLPPIAPVEPRRPWLATVQLQAPPWLVSMVVHLAVLTLLAVVSISANHNGGGGSLTAVLSFSEGDSHSGKGYDESEGSTQSPAFQTSSAQSAPASLQASHGRRAAAPANHVEKSGMVQKGVRHRCAHHPSGHSGNGA